MKKNSRLFWLSALCSLLLALPTHAALSDNLVAYWSLDEASGNAIDAHGANDLTETSGTIGSAAGKVGNCRDFEADDTEFFSIADNADLSIGDITFSCALWLFAETIPVNAHVFGKWSPSGLTQEYLLAALSNEPNLLVRSTSATTGTADWNVDLSTGTWYFVACGHSASADEVWVSVNAGAPVTAVHTDGVRDGALNFIIGSANENYWDGLIDEFGFWKRDIRADLAELYNSGNGRDYTYITGGAAAPAKAPQQVIFSSFAPHRDPLLKLLDSARRPDTTWSVAP